MECNKVVNIMNFVRAVEPRHEMDLMTPVVEEIRLNKKYGFDNTFLLQYDTMMSPAFVELFQREKDDHMELGIWIEMAESLVESIGVEWRGRWEWDWHVNPGFLPAYSKEQKEKIIDTIMARFRELFGYYPKTAGSWVLDSDSVAYMTEEYGLEAFCICRDQWGTDGYTFWGGYYNGPYYPSKNNVLQPAQTLAQQINAPMIRILGPDPIYCYYEKFGMKYNKMQTDLYTLEPTWNCGQKKEWVKWYFRNLLENEDMGYSYTQTGQENPFGWKEISKGLPMQMEYLNELAQAGKIRIEKMCDTGRSFKERYRMTPPSAYSALDDWAGFDNQSVWYSCKNYRLNLFSDEEKVWIRDIHKFDENYRDPYLDHPCQEAASVYDALPVVDGVRFSDEETMSGIFLGEGKIDRIWKEANKFMAQITAEGRKIQLAMEEHQIVLISDEDFCAEFVFKDECLQVRRILKDRIEYMHNGMGYFLILEEGYLERNYLKSENGRIVLHF